MRGVGGSLGTAVFGSIFTNRLADELAGATLPPALQQTIGAGRKAEGLADRAPSDGGPPTSPAATWALVRIDEHGVAGARELVGERP